jgi:DNA gyrase subunit A
MRGVKMKQSNKTYTEMIERTEFSDEMNRSYVDYAMSVIIGRALPDARDGLKPVQRRVLYDMADLHTFSYMPTKKSARIVGDTMGKYHPHGDSSIYDSLVVMAQDFKKRMPLVYGQGNFGSIEGDGAAAQRYTEVRLTKFAEEAILKELDKTVPYVKNYDGTETEPEVLPAKLPLLLLNGADGIAVGMATSIPSHNIVELCDLCDAYICHPEMTTKEMLAILKGPDFSTGGIIANKKELESIYETGTGKLKIRGTIGFESSAGRGDHDKLVITEIPYTMVGSGINKLLNDVASPVTDKTLPEIIDISNQTNKDGIRIVFELRLNTSFLGPISI